MAKKAAKKRGRKPGVAVGPYKKSLSQMIDVTSYYPNAILNMRFAPVAMGAHFLTVMAEIKELRAKVAKLEKVLN